MEVMVPPSGLACTHFLVVSFIVLMFAIGSAINPTSSSCSVQACRCIELTNISQSGEWTPFKSPNWPQSYPRGIQCLSLVVEAPKYHIVHLYFENIRLPQLAKLGCQAGDYIKLFLHLDNNFVTKMTPWNSLLCGEYKHQHFYTASRYLVLLFHSSPHSVQELMKRYGSSSSSSSVSAPKRPVNIYSSIVVPVSFGFSARFRFINSSQFENSGRLVPGTKCDYRFLSENFTSPQGKFFSPLYPSMYPHNTMCTYQFVAGLEERVTIVFEHVALQPGKYSCLNKTDLVRVFNGDSTRAPVITVICNEVHNYEVISTGRKLFIDFIANSDTPGTGFKAKFLFNKIVVDNQFDPMESLKQYFTNKGVPSREEGGLPQASTLVPQCNQLISSDNRKNGSFSSPNFPSPYPPKAHCRIELIGHGRERVRIVFVDFNLYQYDGWEPDKINHSSGIPDYGDNGAFKLFKSNKSVSVPDLDNKCAFADTVSAFIVVDGEERKFATYCGETAPPDLMSNSHRMILEFRAKATTTAPPVRGFFAQYFFIENFGMTDGRQLLNFPCAFVFNSSETKNGTFNSPNFPGLYPRETECHYFFHGQKDDDRVEIHFESLGVHGVPPCLEDDYVELSNHMPTENPKSIRLCGPGIIHPFSVLSDGQFYRMSFKSNEYYDGIGFKASFRFIDEKEQSRNFSDNSTSGKLPQSEPSRANLAMDNPTIFVLVGILMNFLESKL